MELPNKRLLLLNSQLVCLLPVGIFNYVIFIWNICSLVSCLHFTKEYEEHNLQSFDGLFLFITIWAQLMFMYRCLIPVQTSHGTWQLCMDTDLPAHVNSSPGHHSISNPLHWPDWLGGSARISITKYITAEFLGARSISKKSDRSVSLSSYFPSFIDQ